MFAFYSQHHFGLYKHHIVLFWLFWGKVLLCSHGWSGTHYIDKAVLELTRIPLICLEGMGLQTCSATAGLPSILNSYTWSASPLLVVYKLGIRHHLLESVKDLSLTYALLNRDFWSTQHCWILVLRLKTGPLGLCSGDSLSEPSPSVMFLLHSDSWAWRKDTRAKKCIRKNNLSGERQPIRTQAQTAAIVNHIDLPMFYDSNMWSLQK